MRAKMILTVMACLAVTLASATASAVGEDILAHTGQYTFFIKPDPTSCVTYRQKMVPCVEKKTVGVPRNVVLTYGLPIPATQRQRIMVTETPVGHAHGSGPCVQCFPKPVCKHEVKEVIVPRVVPVPVPDVAIQPKCVERRITRPQWFAVEEHPLPPKPVRKVSNPG